MKTLEKYKTFEQLKSAEKAASNTKASLKKHASFEMLVNNIYIAKKRSEAMKRITSKKTA